MSDSTHPRRYRDAAILNLGFRLFFAAAALYSVLTMLAWSGVYLLGWNWQPAVPIVDWHAHEMLFGYAMAVIAGFLLTAVRNWTGVQTLNGVPLLLLFLPWLAARILMAGDSAMIAWAMLFDGLFSLSLLAALAWPVIKVRQFKQIGILSKILLLMLANLLFYAGALEIIPWGARVGLYSGVYLVLALILVMSRRVMPFFIERGVSQPVSLVNRPWVDAAGLILFVGFWIADVIEPDSLAVAWLAGLLCTLHAVRLAGWYAAGIREQSLLWVLYLAYTVVVIGFGLKTAVYVFGISPTLPLHAFTYGGIGLFTLGMMARVTLGHTGRNILEPPVAMAWMFSLLAIGSVFRIAMPLLDVSRYALWIGISQLLWVLSFGIFLYICLPMLARPRADGKPG